MVIKMERIEDWAQTLSPDDVVETDTRTFGKRKEARLYWCANCDKHHWGRYEETGSWTESEWWFVWTTPQGVPKEGDPC